MFIQVVLETVENDRIHISAFLSVDGNNISTISYGKDSPVGNKSDYKDIEEYHARNRVVTTIVETR